MALFKLTSVIYGSSNVNCINVKKKKKNYQNQDPTRGSTANGVGPARRGEVQLTSGGGTEREPTGGTHTARPGGAATPSLRAGALAGLQQQVCVRGTGHPGEGPAGGVNAGLKE